MRGQHMVSRDLPPTMPKAPPLPAPKRPMAWELNLLLGKATWQWDDELGMHIPVCSRFKYNVRLGAHRCGNGPLSDAEIEEGTCSEGPHLMRHERSI